MPNSSSTGPKAIKPWRLEWASLDGLSKELMMKRLSLAEARELAESILLHHGFNLAHAQAVAATVCIGYWGV